MIRGREELEALEERSLASYGSRSRSSRGRLHPEHDDPLRTAHQRDRDRVLHSEAFRRLEYKTQVFVESEGDHYRTRLTHTIEVSQLARSLAAFLGANVDLANCVALLHDLGHPPFGHQGEVELDRMAKQAGLQGFDHNLHCLRIVDLLERRYDFPGLNLTWEARAWTKDPNETTPDELHALLLERGLMRPGEEVLYLAGYRGGQVNTQLGEYVFNCQAIFRFHEGRTTLHEPAIFSGKVLSTLGAIVAGIGPPVIDRLGTCGKQGQGVPSSGGGPAFTVIEPCPDAVIGGRGA